MIELLIVGAGGALGSMARYAIGKKISAGARSGFPFGTFAVNISGAFLLGVVIGSGLSGNWYLLFADGFLGSFTTFSTFMYEGFKLFQDKKELNAAIYIVASVLTGLAGFSAGLGLVSLIR